MITKEELLYKLDNANKEQSRECVTQGRRIFYALFAAAWLSLYSKKEHSAFLIAAMIAGVLYALFFLYRYYRITEESRRIYKELDSGNKSEEETTNEMKKISELSFALMKVEFRLLFLMGLTLCIHYIIIL